MGSRSQERILKMKTLLFMLALATIATAADYQKTQGNLNLFISEYRNDAISIPVRGMESNVKMAGLWIVVCTNDKNTTPPPTRFILDYRHAGKVVTLSQLFMTGDYCSNVLIPNVMISDIVNFDVVTKSESFRDMY
jgi:hypothetical protein